MSGTVAHPIGLTDPPIDDLLEVADSKYGLVIYASKRARQINGYYAQLNEGLLEYVGPLVEASPQDKPLSIGLREINQGLLKVTAAEEEVTPQDAVTGLPHARAEAAQAAATAAALAAFSDAAPLPAPVEAPAEPQDADAAPAAE